MSGRTQHTILALVLPSQTHLLCLHSQILHLSSPDMQLKGSPLRGEWNVGTQRV